MAVGYWMFGVVMELARSLDEDMNQRTVASGPTAPWQFCKRLRETRNLELRLFLLTWVPLKNRSAFVFDAANLNEPSSCNNNPLSSFNSNRQVHTAQRRPAEETQLTRPKHADIPSRHRPKSQE